MVMACEWQGASPRLIAGLSLATYLSLLFLGLSGFSISPPVSEGGILDKDIRHQWDGR